MSGVVAGTDPFPALVAHVLGKEGGYVNDPVDRGKETNWGITVAVARAFGYTGPMRDMTRADAVAIYRARYWTQPRFDQIHAIFPALAAELFDTGINMGQAVAGTFLQRSLNVLNREGVDFPDLTVDGNIGAMTVAGLRAFLAQRGDAGRRMLLGMVNAMQSVRYVEIAERKPSQERFMAGWQGQRAFPE